MNQKKSLKAYQLFLIGLATMLIGTYVVTKIFSQMAGGILVLAGLFFWLMAIVVFIKKLLNKSPKSNTSLPPDFDTSNPGSDENTARVMLHTYGAYRKQHPNDDAMVAYARVLSDRPGYDRETIKNLLQKAHMLGVATHGRFGLRAIVSTMILDEYKVDNGREPDDSTMRAIIDGVELIIPADL